MSLKFEKNKQYSMPVFFGPTSLSNRPAGNGRPAKAMHEYYQPGDINAISITYETDRAVLESMIPECYTLNDPYVSVAVCEFTNLGWMAGHTYNLINVSVPVHFKGERDDLDGDLVLVMFENHPDPIVGGRDFMGYSKIYADIPRITHDENKYVATASSWDFRFMKLTVDVSKPVPDLETLKSNEARSQGKMSYKYIPSTKERDEDITVNHTKADIAYPTILPKWEKPDDYPYEIMTPEIEFCDGNIEFYKPEWEDMPTYYHVGTGLNALVCKRVIGAKRMRYNDPTYYATCYKLK